MEVLFFFCSNFIVKLSQKIRIEFALQWTAKAKMAVSPEKSDVMYYSCAVYQRG